MDDRKKQIPPGTADLSKPLPQTELESELLRLQKENSYLNAIIDNSYDAIYITDGNGKPIRFNQAYSDMSGLIFDDVKDLATALQTEGRFVSKAATPIALLEKRAVTLEQTLFRTGRKVMVTSKPVLNEAGEVAFVILNIRDISELEALKRNLSEEDQRVSRYMAKLDLLRERVLAQTQLIARDVAMLDVLEMAQKVAKTDSTVLLTGETGVGKEEVAKYIHCNSNRSEKIFITINCGAIPESLIESELFGYEEGAFTGAKSKGKMGLFEAANDGTIFLDEIGELPLEMQVKLLRVLQEQEIKRVGGIKPIKINVRVIAATNRDLMQMVHNGTFRIDLYYRISVIPIEIPPLRKRKDDIMPLAHCFLDEQNLKYGYSKSFAEKTKKTLLAYDWPGNVRELRNVVEREIVSDKFSIPEGGTILSELLEQIEYSYMEKAYEKFGNVRDAAEALGFKRSTFAQRMKMLKDKYEVNTLGEKNV